MFCEVDDLFMYIIVTRDDNTADGAAQHVTHKKGLHTTITLALEIGGVKFVTSTRKIANLHCG